jgi:arginase
MNDRHRVGLGLLGVPSSAGSHNAGQDKAPARWRAAGLVDRLVELITGDGSAALVLGGDCTITLGVLAGLARRTDVGLVYFDGDVDLNVPESSGSGVLDTMGMTHALGGGIPRLSGLGQQSPMLADDRVVLFGFDPGELDTGRWATLTSHHLYAVPAPLVRADPSGQAAQALSYLENRVDSVLIHLDVDVLDTGAFPLANFPGMRPARGATDHSVPRCPSLLEVDQDHVERPGPLRRKAGRRAVQAREVGLRGQVGHAGAGCFEECVDRHGARVATADGYSLQAGAAAHRRVVAAPASSGQGDDHTGADRDPNGAAGGPFRVGRRACGRWRTGCQGGHDSNAVHRIHGVVRWGGRGGRG